MVIFERLLPLLAFIFLISFLGYWMIERGEFRQVLKSFLLRSIRPGAVVIAIFVIILTMEYYSYG